MKPNLTELASIIHDAQTLDEFWGAVRIWAGSIITGRPPREIAYIEVFPCLNYRQQWAYDLACQRGRIVSADVARRFNISMESARLDLHDLVEWGKLLPVSEKKGRYYLPVIPNQDDPSGHQGMAEGVSGPFPGGVRDTLFPHYLNTDV